MSESTQFYRNTDVVFMGMLPITGVVVRAQGPAAMVQNASTGWHKGRHMAAH